jgi:small subunit ribosomal protein S4
MARHTGPVCRLCRREGQKLFLKGTRCYTEKCAIERRGYPPGVHGRMAGRRRKQSEYATQLREKQKVKRIYGVLESQFENYFTKSAKTPGVTGENLLVMLERRLDNLVYRLGLAPSRSRAAAVCHRHITVNGRDVLRTRRLRRAHSGEEP